MIINKRFLSFSNLDLVLFENLKGSDFHDNEICF